MRSSSAVIPGYFLVWYDADVLTDAISRAVIPGYFLVWYDSRGGKKVGECCCDSRLFLGMV